MNEQETKKFYKVMYNQYNSSQDDFYHEMLRFCSEWEYQNPDEALSESYVRDMLLIMKNSIKLFYGERRRFLSHMIIKIMMSQINGFDKIQKTLKCVN